MGRKLPVQTATAPPPRAAVLLLNVHPMTSTWLCQFPDTAPPMPVASVAEGALRCMKSRLRTDKYLFDAPKKIWFVPPPARVIRPAPSTTVALLAVIALVTA